MSDVAAMEAPTWDERASIIQPRLPAFWLFAFLIALGAIGTLGSVDQLLGETNFVSSQLSSNTSSALFAMTLMIAWAIPVVIAVHALDLFEREPFGMLAGAFAWGYLAAANLVVPGNTAIHGIVAKLASPDVAHDWGAAIAAPICEESFKAMGLLLLVLIAAKEIDSPVDGLVYGAFVGLGFQIEEDFWYLTTHTSGLHEVWDLFIIRGFAGGLWSHAAFTGLVGLAIGYLVSRPDIPQPRRIQYVFLAFGGAMLMHFIWNSPWLDGWSTGWLGIFVVAIIKGLPGVLLIAALYFHARRREALWVEHVLAPEVDTGAVTPAEITALLTFQGRRRERAAARQSGGSGSARRTKELQREQVALAVDLTRTKGAVTPEIERHRATIAHLRELLASAPKKLQPSSSSPPAV